MIRGSYMLTIFKHPLHLGQHPRLTAGESTLIQDGADHMNEVERGRRAGDVGWYLARAWARWC
jgi:hypothetical protein